MLWERLDFRQDFKLIGMYENVRGEYFSESKRSVVYLVPHENIEDIISTCIHETLHSLIEDIDENGELDIEQEHEIIRKMQWAFEAIPEGTPKQEKEYKKLMNKYNKLHR